MRYLSRRLAALVATAALAWSAAACGSSSSRSSSAGGTPATGAFPASITTAIGVVHVRSRPAASVSLSPSTTEMLYAIGAGSHAWAT
jgi:iron complex transport system substrate-binding protein